MASPSPTPSLAPSANKTTHDHDTLWRWNLLCQTACLSITGIMFVLRTYIRIWLKRVWILEDYLCCLAFVSLAVYSGLLTTIMYKHGGTHIWDLTRADVGNILYYVNIIQIWYGPAAACTKSAILLLYLRFFVPYRWSKLDIAIRAFILIICGFYFSITIAKICQCLPRARIWDKTVAGKCVNLSAILGTSGMFNIASDICILLVPLKGVWNLQISQKRKIGIYAIFTVGLIAPVFSTIGFVMRFKLTSSLDQSYNQPLILLWATAELATGMMVICLPTLPGILQHRVIQPSMSINIINGSAKARNAISDPRFAMRRADDDDLVDRGYFELREGRSNGLVVKVPRNNIINEITGGEGECHMGYGPGPNSDHNIKPGGIMKMVDIEQSDV